MYNPYDLIEITVNSHVLYGRPIEFDSEAVDLQKMTNKEGNIVKPTKLVTVCPDCGQGIERNIPDQEPPFKLDIKCENCNPATITVDISDNNQKPYYRQNVETSEEIQSTDLDSILIKDLDQLEESNQTLQEQLRGVDLSMAEDSENTSSEPSLKELDLDPNTSQEARKITSRTKKKASKKTTKKASKKTKKKPKII